MKIQSMSMTNQSVVFLHSTKWFFSIAVLHEITPCEGPKKSIPEQHEINANLLG